jgi:hypothetical protein
MSERQGEYIAGDLGGKSLISKEEITSLVNSTIEQRDLIIADLQKSLASLQVTYDLLLLRNENLKSSLDDVSEYSKKVLMVEREERMKTAIRNWLAQVSKRYETRGRIGENDLGILVDELYRWLVPFI